MFVVFLLRSLYRAKEGDFGGSYVLTIYRSSLVEELDSSEGSLTRLRENKIGTDR